MKRRLTSFVKKVIRYVRKPEMEILPGQLAFYFVMTLVPLLILFASVLTLFNLSGEYVSGVIIEYLPSGVADLVIDISEHSSMNMGAWMVVVTSLILASNGTDSMILASNFMYKVEGKGLIKRRLKSIFMLLCLVLLFMVVILVPVFGNLIFKILYKIFAYEGINQLAYLVFRVLKYPISFLLIYFLVKILYLLGPDVKVSHKSVVFGSLFTTLSWIVATVIYGFYVENFANYSDIYGSLANIIVLMFWVYLLAYIFVIGMAFNVARYESLKESS